MLCCSTQVCAERHLKHKFVFVVRFAKLRGHGLGQLLPCKIPRAAYSIFDNCFHRTQEMPLEDRDSLVKTTSCRSWENSSPPRYRQGVFISLYDRLCGRYEYCWFCVRRKGCIMLGRGIAGQKI